MYFLNIKKKKGQHKVIYLVKNLDQIYEILLTSQISLINKTERSIKQKSVLPAPKWSIC